MIRPQTLDCQLCGMPLRTLNAAEAAQVAARPYDFILYCPLCQAAAMSYRAPRGRDGSGVPILEVDDEWTH